MGDINQAIILDLLALAYHSPALVPSLAKIVHSSLEKIKIAPLHSSGYGKTPTPQPHKIFPGDLKTAAKF